MRYIGEISKYFHFPYEGMFGGTAYEKEVIGNGYIDLTDAVVNKLLELKAYGGCVQDLTPTPTTPVDIVCNNGALKVSPNLFDISKLNIDTSPSDTVSYKAYSVPNGTYTMSTPDFPLVSKATNIFFLAGNVSSGAATTSNGVSQGTPRTITVSDGYYTIGYRSGISNPNNPKDYSWQIEKGSTATSYMPYGQIYTDGAVETVGVYGNNIFNKNDTDNLGNRFSSSLMISQASSNATLVMRAIPNATYYYKHCSVTGGGRAFYTEVEDWEIGSDCSSMVGATTIDKNQVRSITVSANAKWVFFLYGRSGQTETFEEQLADYMVSLTPITESTPYEPYFNGGTATCEKLLGVGDYVDEQEILSGNVIRNVGIKVLDGTENWSSYGSGNCWANSSVLGDKVSGNAQSYCTHYDWSSLAPNTMANNSFLLSGTYRLCIKDDRFQTDTAFKQYLAEQYAAGTPVIIVYPLAEPTTETVTGQTLSIQKGDNRIEIVDGSILDLPLYAKYLSTTE